MSQATTKTQLGHIKSKVDTAANWAKENSYILLDREIGYEKETGKYKIGDGQHHWSELPDVKFGGSGGITEKEFIDLLSANLNITNGEDDETTSLQQVSNDESWTSSNEKVKQYVKNSTPGANNGLTINGTANGDTVTINVGAFGKLSTMMNGKSQTIGGKSHAEGSKTIALENNSHAEGNDTFAAGAHSHVEGNLSSALGNASHAEGVATIAEGSFSHAEGQLTEANGVASHAEGSETQAFGNNSHAEGNNSHAMWANSHAEGEGTFALQQAAHAEGMGTSAHGEASHAEGKGSVTSEQGIGAHAEGLGTTAKNSGAHSEGVSTDATNEASHAEGYDTTASGRAAHAEGSNTTASEANSHAEGEWAQAKGYSSHAEGGYTEARGSYNHVSGFRNISDGDYQTVIGKANKIDSTKAFIIGNGEIKNDFTVDNNKRSNAVEVDWNGNAIFAGEVKSGNNTLITEKTLKEGFYNKEEADILLNAQSIELKKSINLTGDKIPNKTSTYIYVENITNGNKVEFGNKFEYKGKQWFGYVGIKKAAVTQGTSYMMIAEVDVETELNLDILTVSGFYCPTEGWDTATGNPIGKLKKGKNYIMYPFTAGTYERYGFYMDSQVSGSDNVINFTLQDVRLYERKMVKSGINISGLKDWKTNILTNDNLIASEIGDYVLVYNGYNLIINSLSNNITAEVLLYKPFPEVDKYYRPNITPFSPNPQSGAAVMGAIDELKQLVDKKTIEYSYYSGTNNKIKLKKGVLYLIMSSDTDITVYNENDVRVKDTENNQLPASKTIVILTTSNDLDINQHIYMNYFLNIEKGTSILNPIPSFTTKNFQLTRVKEALDPNTESLPYCTIGSSANVYELYLG